jgi:hypothetical protein
VSRVRWCRVLRLVPVAVVVGSPGLDVGDRWQRQLRGSSRVSYLVGKELERGGQREAVQRLEEEVVGLLARWNGAVDRRVRAVR